MTLVTRKRWQTEKRCCDKATYGTEAEAQAALDRKKRVTFGAPAPSGVYRCKHGSYHLKDRAEPTQDGLTEWERIKAGVSARDSHRCIRCGTSRHLDPHHRRLKSQGGEDQPQNLIMLCRTCHDVVHANRADAEKAGLIVQAGADPLKVPVEHREWDVPVLLTSDYRYGMSGGAA